MSEIITKLKYLFNWNDVPGKDDEKLKYHLANTLELDWVKNVVIRKKDYKTITVTKDENSLEIELNEKKDRVTLKNSDGKTHNYIVEQKGGKLNIL
ncbi:hypothetical protein BEH94_03070 [Candidatus Altiarchaeales archaeon WOR_SM1_SCG]|nr:hypothetical protein BEH94_03070 [Candidatus Altiarchaeales archaeon WOR_SM1_SCG]